MKNRNPSASAHTVVATTKAHTTGRGLLELLPGDLELAVGGQGVINDVHQPDDLDLDRLQ